MTLSMLQPLAPLLMLVLGGIAIMVGDAFDDKKSSYAVPTAVLFGIVILIDLVLARGAISFELPFTGRLLEMDPGTPPVGVSAFLATDRAALFFDVVICAGGAFSALLAGGYLREHDLERGEFYVLLVFSAVGAIILARAVDLLTLFIGLEAMSLGVYSMVGFRRTSARSAEGAIKYFLLGSFAAAILLFGSSLLYGATGETGLAAIGRSITEGHADLRLASLGMFMVIVGLAFKVGAVPFHMWTPDAYDGAVTPATTFMSVVVKAAAFAVLSRVLVTSFGDELSSNASNGWPPFIAIIAGLTMVIGNLAAVAQSSVKRMLAYSSIAHAGYILVGVAAIPGTDTAAISAVFFYTLAYTASNALAFGSLIILGSRGKESTSYEDLAGVGRRHPLAAAPFILAVLSLMGMPPTAGFFAKYYVFSAAVQAGGPMIALAILGLLTSAIGAYYYLRVLVFMFMKEPQPGAPIAVPMKSRRVAVALAIAANFVMLMGLTPSAYLDAAIAAAAQLG